ncbi:HNH endonuclease family protein [Nocardioides dubius]|uniref:GmrSD restriction endonucleases C-terminal domain-containing protein n=1 Tax=Nocardioides dubius TaxID=317019 RepID=A0ABN1TU69_9ACTN
MPRLPHTPSSALPRLCWSSLVALLMLAGCTLDVRFSDDADSTAPSAAPALSPARATRLLESLPRAPRVRPTDYRREAFGSAWRDTDRNGCNQRDDVLLRDAVAGSTRVQQQGRCDHDVLAGTWVDPYSGRTLTLDDLKDPSQAQAVQIDHVVPLAEAWASGASAWTPERRAEYANDLDVLLAVDGPTNASKGADDPAAWRPRKGYQCAYAVHWIAIKDAWRLSADPSEVDALREMLGYC